MARSPNSNSEPITRRQLIQSATLGSLALGSLVNAETRVAPTLPAPHFAPKAKRVIYLFQSGGPSQLDLFDYKPELQKFDGQEVPTSVYPADRKTTMTRAQTKFPTAASRFRFHRHGQSGVEMCELLHHTAKHADDLCVIRSMYTDAINHDPAITFFQTGSQIPGRPSIGAWLSYGLGSLNQDLPTFVAMSSKGRAKAGQPLYDRLWGAGFLPAEHQGVKFRNQGAPVLDLANPPGVKRSARRRMLDLTAQLNEQRYQANGDPEIRARIEQYELAFRMQTSVPELVDFRDETEATLSLYGPDVRTPGRYAYNCLLARRLAERGVRFIQLFHQGWDQHNGVPTALPKQCRDTDQPTAALLADLKQRGLLDDTLVVWGGEFGRTVYSQGTFNVTTYGRDHHPSCFSVWLAGAGVKGGVTWGRTDDYSANVVEDGVEVHDLNATIMHLLGIDHKQLTYKYQGRHFRLTDVHGHVLHPLLS